MRRLPGRHGDSCLHIMQVVILMPSTKLCSGYGGRCASITITSQCVFFATSAPKRLDITSLRGQGWSRRCCRGHRSHEQVRKTITLSTCMCADSEPSSQSTFPQNDFVELYDERRLCSKQNIIELVKVKHALKLCHFVFTRAKTSNEDILANQMIYSFF